jgi:hypothetical protein
MSILEYPQMTINPPSDDIYLRCLRAKKYNLPAAAKLVNE